MFMDYFQIVFSFIVKGPNAKKEPPAVSEGTSIVVEKPVNESAIASSNKSETKLVKNEAKKSETTVLYLSKKESTKKVLQVLKQMIRTEDQDENEVKPAQFLTQKIFSNDTEVIKTVLHEEGEFYFY